MRPKLAQLALLPAVLALVPSCHSSPPTARKGVQAPSAPEVVHTQWTDAAARRTEALLAANKITYELPEVRVYDVHQQLIYHQAGTSTHGVAQTIGAAIEASQPIAGPTYAESLANLETTDHRPAASILNSKSAATTIVDYWASWCVPCKVLEKRLLAWAALQPPGSVRIVRAEADITKLERAGGHKVYKLEKGPDGKLIKVEMK